MNMLNLDEARRITAAAQAEAIKNDWKVVIAILDDSGHLICLERMDGTQKASCKIAEEKGRTAILFKRPSKALEEAVNGGRIALLSLPGAVCVEGGLPLVRNGEFLGAIGVSGVQSHQDGIVAAAGVACFEQQA
ncbi:MAG: heme-binding protein [Proteobacteria bacterium]|nr:heme-binding protein [Pseudomonadota bacterium]